MSKPSKWLLRRARPPVTKTIAQCRKSGREGARLGGFHCAASRKKPVTLPDPVGAARARLEETRVLSEAIPPAYAEYVGRAALKQLEDA